MGDPTPPSPTNPPPPSLQTSLSISRTRIRQRIRHIVETTQHDPLDGSSKGQRFLRAIDLDVHLIMTRVLAVFTRPGTYDTRSLVREPDRWGTGLCVLLYSFVVALGQSFSFPWVLITWVLGAGLVHWNVKLVGRLNDPFLGVLCVLAYSLVPIILVSLVLLLVDETHNLLVAFLLKFFVVLWTSKRAGEQLVTKEQHDKRLLVLYPVILLYVYSVSLRSIAG